ncbi:uncharacterized protein VDAG_09559 [Verticillium dahliae VdLs.17]|uniref:Uncharacterized protein n=1 Tax=Verticillium dahliae (strain VdLs.17 / ATCC MYA-4575 / FGSC 10137) TaxID=498257 RepID=G2XHC7_VERDV|nr:uncharacterized protein VDAG_09559 [Verticillium dahliae VdLs.17]EGY19225.1 hypothetical protein VDAG_09559 [Verticillium dahliae VdLs.17]
MTRAGSFDGGRDDVHAGTAILGRASFALLCSFQTPLPDIEFKTIHK